MHLWRSQSQSTASRVCAAPVGFVSVHTALVVFCLAENSKKFSPDALCTKSKFFFLSRIASKRLKEGAVMMGQQVAR